MDWSEEPWVKLYTRETPTMAMLPWDSRALLHELMKRGGPIGRIDVGRHGIRSLAALVRMPEDVVSRGLDDLVADEIIRVDGDCETVFIINFYEAQKARTSDKERKRRSRESKAAAEQSKAAKAKADSGDGDARPVTDGHSESPIEETRGEEKRLDPPIPPRGLWDRSFDQNLAPEYLTPLWDAFGDGHPTPGFTAAARLAEKTHRFLVGRDEAERAERCAAVVALTKQKYAPKKTVEYLLECDWGESLNPQGDEGTETDDERRKRLHRKVYGNAANG